MRWALLTLAVASVLVAGRLWARLHRREMSTQWLLEQDALRRKQALEYEGVSHVGRFKR
jgi:hypothetical protein